MYDSISKTRKDQVYKEGEKAFDHNKDRIKECPYHRNEGLMYYWLCGWLKKEKEYQTEKEINNCPYCGNTLVEIKSGYRCPDIEKCGYHIQY